jgi:hypothetical protein
MTAEVQIQAARGQLRWLAADVALGPGWSVTCSGHSGQVEVTEDGRRVMREVVVERAEPFLPPREWREHMGESLARLLPPRTPIGWFDDGRRIVTALSEAPGDLTRYERPRGLRLVGPRGTGSLDADLRAAGAWDPSIWPGPPLPVTFVAGADGVIRLGTVRILRLFGDPSTLSEPGPGRFESLTMDTLRAWGGILGANLECDCADCLRSRQIKHLTAFVAGDQVEALLEYARADDEATFKGLAACLGVEATLLGEMWAGTRARLGPRKDVPRGTRPTDPTDNPSWGEAPTEAEIARAVQWMLGRQVPVVSVPFRGRLAGEIVAGATDETLQRLYPFVTEGHACGPGCPICATDRDVP